jgi:hypothetical protein
VVLYNSKRYELTKTNLKQNWFLQKQVLISKIVGFISMHNHRASVVFQDKYLSPVISAMQSDIIMFGNNLREYLKSELLRI